MKTSNKILFSLYGFAILCIFSFFIFMRSTYVPYENTLKGQEKVYEFDKLDKIYCDRNFYYDIKITKNPYVKIINDLKTIELIDVKVTDGLLKVNSTKLENQTGRIKVEVGMSDLKKIKINSLSKISCESTIQIDSVYLDLNGGAVADLNLNTKLLSIKSNGNAFIKLQGSTNNLNLDCNGVSKISGDQFVINQAKVLIQGLSKTELNVQEKIEGTVHMGSKLILSKEVDESDLIRL